jgi:hypothetical protein
VTSGLMDYDGRASVAKAQDSTLRSANLTAADHDDAP